MRSQSDSFDILERALDAAQADEADALFVSTDQNITRFANSSVHQNMSELSAELTLRVIVNNAVGVASTTAFDADEIARTAALAREAARHGDALQNFSGLYRDAEPAPALRTFDERVAAMPPAEKARALRTMFERGREKSVAFAGAYGTGASSYACGNSHGVRRYCTATASSASVIAVGASASGYAAATGRDDVDVVTLGDEAVVKATLCAGVESQLAPGAYDVILEPAAVGEVLEWLDMIAFSGSAFDDGSSFFVGNIGKQVLGTNLTIADDAGSDEVDVTIAASGSGGGPLTVEAHTADDTLTSGETGSQHNNAGAGGTVILTLPAASAGIEFYFYVASAFSLRIDAGAADTIEIAGSTTIGAGNIRSATIGHAVHLICIDVTRWVGQSIVGAGWAVA